MQGKPRISAWHPVLAMTIGTLTALAAVSASAQLIFSEREAMRQARTEWTMMKRETPQYGNSRVQRYIECISNDLIEILDDEWQDLAWEVVVFDVDETNAFVLPGGKIAVFSGILNVADTADAIAAVIGHEIAHMTEGHTISRGRRAQRSTMAAIGLGAATGISADYFRFGTNIGLDLPFARNQESEADRVGLEYMAKAGYDPRAGLQLWQNMKLANENRGRPPQWMATHPREDDRMTDMIPMLVPNLQLYNAAQEAGRVPNCAAESR